MIRQRESGGIEHYLKVKIRMGQGVIKVRHPVERLAMTLVQNLISSRFSCPYSSLIPALQMFNHTVSSIAYTGAISTFYQINTSRTCIASTVVTGDASQKHNHTRHARMTIGAERRRGTLSRVATL